MSMSMLRRRGVLVLLGAALALTQAAPTRAEDVARVMPRETALYVGWSQWLAKDSPELQSSRAYLKAACGMIVETSHEVDAKSLGQLFDVLPLLQAGSVGVGVFDVTIENKEPDVQAALVVEPGGDPSELVGAVHGLIAMSNTETKAEPCRVRDVPMESLQIGDGSAKLVWGVCEHRFVLALGETAAGKVIDCITGKAPNLAEADELKFDRAKVKARADGKHFCIYTDVQRIIARAKELAAQQLGTLPPSVEPTLDELGVGAVKSKYFHIDEQDGQPHAAAFAHVSGPSKGLLKLWEQSPLTDDDLKIVPKDAYWAEVFNLDLAKLWAEATRVLTALAPDQAAMVEGGLAMSKSMLGFSITADLLPAFGDTWSLFDAPDHGGILLSGTVLAADVKDPDALQGMLTRAVELLTPLLESEKIALQLKKIEHGGHTIHYVLVGGVPSPVAPAWGFAAGRGVFGLFPQTVATALKQVDPQTRGASLLDSPDFQASRARLPREVQSVGYFDSRYFTRMYYPFMSALQTLAVSMLAKHGAEIDFAVMPPLPEQAAAATNYVGTTSTDKDGILYSAVGSGATLTPVVAGTALGVSVLLPSLSRARELAKRTVSAANLRGVGQACIFYANDHADKLPESLEPLLSEGLVMPKQLHSPRDPDSDADAISYVYVVGLSLNAKSPSETVLAYEKIFDREGTNVLFLDAHVEWMTLAAFRAAVARTYQQLGRELPADIDQATSAPSVDDEVMQKLRALGYVK